MFFSSGKNNSNNTQAEPYMNAPKSRAVTGPIHTNEGHQPPFQPPYPQGPQGPQGYGPYGPEHPQFPRFNPYNNHPNMGGGYPPFPYQQPQPQPYGPQQSQDGLYAEQKSDKKGAQKENLKSLSFWQDDNDYYDQAAETPRGSPIKFIAAIMGLVVFTIIVWLGYRFATQPQNDQIPLIQAEAGPYKRRPENPGGANFPHQEMLVYGRLDPQANNQTVEHVLPQEYAPDQQYPQQYPQQDQQQPYEQYPQQIEQQQMQMQPQQMQQQMPQQQVVPQQPVQHVSPQVAQPQMQQQPVQVAQQQAAQGVVSPDQVAIAASNIEKALETVEEMPAAAAAAAKTKASEDVDPKALTPGYYMQLGKPLPSEKSAQSHWAWIKKKFPSELSDMKPIIRPTDAGVKKKFSVLVGPFSSRNAALKKCVKISNGCSVKHIG